MIAIIDFEATALSMEADPIEVGVAIYNRDALIRTWSSLIRPNKDCLWDEKSAAVHKIARLDLEVAPLPTSVALELNRLMAGSETAYCDGYEYDNAWLERLYQEAGVVRRFEIAAIEEMPRMHLRVVRHHMFGYLARTAVPHRAKEDALRLMQSYLYALGKKADVVSAS